MKYLGGLLVGIILFTIACTEEVVEPISPIEQFFIDSELIDIWLTENAVTDTLIEPNSQIRYTINVEGPATGISPRFNEGDSIKVKYEGRLLDTGAIFDSADSAELALDRTIPGWQIMLPLMSEGDEYTIYLQSIYGYGTSGNGSTIPENANLIFDVELIRVK